MTAPRLPEAIKWQARFRAPGSDWDEWQDITEEEYQEYTEVPPLYFEREIRRLYAEENLQAALTEAEGLRAWQPTQLSTGQMADAYQCLVSAAKECGQIIEHPAPGGEVGFQSRVAPWMQECFGPEISADRIERGDRLLEEVLELLQSGGYDPARVLALRDYVYGRPVGEPSQEVGGVMVTLAAYCLAHDLDMHDAGDTELARILRPEIIAKIRAKQASKKVGDALPVANPTPGGAREVTDAMVEAACSKNYPYWGSFTKESERLGRKVMRGVLEVALAAAPQAGG